MLGGRFAMAPSGAQQPLPRCGGALRARAAAGWRAPATGAARPAWARAAAWSPAAGSRPTPGRPISAAAGLFARGDSFALPRRAAAPRAERRLSAQPAGLLGLCDRDRRLLRCASSASPRPAARSTSRRSMRCRSCAARGSLSANAFLRRQPGHIAAAPERSRRGGAAQPGLLVASSSTSGTRISTSRSRSGRQLRRRISNWVGLIWRTPSPQKLTRFSGAPLSTTSRKSPIGERQLPPVVRI